MTRLRILRMSDLISLILRSYLRKRGKKEGRKEGRIEGKTLETWKGYKDELKRRKRKKRETRVVERNRSWIGQSNT